MGTLDMSFCISESKCASASPLHPCSLIAARTPTGRSNLKLIMCLWRLVPSQGVSAGLSSVCFAKT